MSTRVWPGEVTDAKVTSTSRAGTTETFVPTGVKTPLADPSSGGSGTPNGLPGAGADVGVPGVTVKFTAPVVAHTRSRSSDTSEKPPWYVWLAARSPGDTVNVTDAGELAED